MLGRGKKAESGKAVSPDRPVEGKSSTFLSRSTAKDEKTIIVPIDWQKSSNKRRKNSLVNNFDLDCRSLTSSFSLLASSILLSFGMVSFSTAKVRLMATIVIPAAA